MTTRNLLLFPAAFALLALTCARAADAGYTLGVPGAPTLRMSADAGDNAWLLEGENRLLSRTEAENNSQPAVRVSGDLVIGG